MVKSKFIEEAENYEKMRDKLGRDQLDNFKVIKSQLADWYIAIAAACFAIGGIAISLGQSITRHPTLFGWASVLLITNGIFIFFIRKIEIESESSGFIELKQKEADLWTMSKVAREHANGDSSRADVFAVAANRFVKDYDRFSKPLTRWQWVKFIAYSCVLDITFGLLLFPILMLAPQLPNYLHISFRTYTFGLWATLTFYLGYIVLQAVMAVKEKKKSSSAMQQTKDEVDKNRKDYAER